MSKGLHWWLLGLGIGLLLLGGCSFPKTAGTPTLPPGAIYTAAAQTVAAVLTESAPPATPTPASSPTAVVGAAPTETPTISPGTLTPAPTSASGTKPCNMAYLVGDITIPDGTLMLPGEKFTKTWRLRNTGSCAWTPDYALIFVRGFPMGAPEEVPMDTVVQPGESVDVSVDMVAPQDPGAYTGFWRLRAADGEVFGLGRDKEVFWVQIVVVVPTGAVSPTATP